MRKVLTLMLLASAAATPALAAPADREARQQARAERQQSRDGESNDNNRDARRPQVSQPQVAAPVERPQRMIEQRARMVEAPARAQAQGQGRADVRDLQALRDARRPARDWRAAPSQANPAVDPRQRFDQARERNEQRRQDARERIAERQKSRPPIVSPTPRPGTQPPPPVAQRPTTQAHWNHDWRHDNRYNWSDYRRHHHSLFNLGFYFDPFGWGYQRYNIGWRMWPSYFSNQYWLNDPWQYRLPYAPPGYRWVRYWDDAVLVDTWSGEVVDVIYSFFW